MPSFAEIVSLRAPGRRGRLSRDRKEALIAQLRQLKASGMTLKAAASELGLSLSTVYSWREAINAEGTFRPVTVAPMSARGPVLITPSGYRVEGLDAPGLADLLRVLG